MSRVVQVCRNISLLCRNIELRVGEWLALAGIICILAVPAFMTRNERKD